MLVYTVGAEDLLGARFGVSTLSECSLSLKAVRNPRAYPNLRALTTATYARVATRHLEVLVAVVAPDNSTPDFLNPRPTPRPQSFVQELDAVRHVPARVIDHDLDAIYPEGRPDALTGSTEVVRSRIIDAFADYWTRCFQQWWPSVHAVLTTDVRERGRWGLERGVMAMLDGLSPFLEVSSSHVVCKNPGAPAYEQDARRSDLVFIPTLFTGRVSYPFSPSESPYVLYPARGAATLAERLPEPSSHLTHLLGSSRSRALVAASRTTSSSELARRTETSVSAASQHLRWLQESGLVVSSRAGRSVLYEVTAAGRALLSMDEM